MDDPDAALARIAALHELVQRHTKCGPGCLRKDKCRHLDRPSADYSLHQDTVAFPVATSTGRAAYSFGPATPLLYLPPFPRSCYSSISPHSLGHATPLSPPIP